jgi:hypothetical protein
MIQAFQKAMRSHRARSGNSGERSVSSDERAFVEETEKFVNNVEKLSRLPEFASEIEEETGSTGKQDGAKAASTNAEKSGGPDHFPASFSQPSASYGYPGQTLNDYPYANHIYGCNGGPQPSSFSHGVHQGCMHHQPSPMGPCSPHSPHHPCQQHAAMRYPPHTAICPYQHQPPGCQPCGAVTPTMAWWSAGFQQGRMQAWQEFQQQSAQFADTSHNVNQKYDVPSKATSAPAAASNATTIPTAADGVSNRPTRCNCQHCHSSSNSVPYAHYGSYTDYGQEGGVMQAHYGAEHYYHY